MSAFLPKAERNEVIIKHRGECNVYDKVIQLVPCGSMIMEGYMYTAIICVQINAIVLVLLQFEGSGSFT